MKTISPLDRAAFSELLDLCQIDAEKGASPYKLNGSFIQERRNRGADEYWYYRGYEKTVDGSPGRATKTYVGPVGDKAIDALVAVHEVRRASYVNRRHLVSCLKRAGMASPDPTEGAIVKALAEAGIFASGAMIVGSAAFQTYGGLLGIRPDVKEHETKDIDLAQPRGLTIEPGPKTSIDLLDALKSADTSFEPFFLQDEPNLVLGFKNSRDFRVEFLTPLAANREGKNKGKNILSAVVGLPGVGAQQLKFLEFSLVDRATSVMLFDAGILVPVPDPARFAVHKLIVSAIRTGAGKGDDLKAYKDVLQAQSLIEGFAHIQNAVRLGSVWLEALNRGPKWRKALKQGTLRLSAKHLPILADAVTEAAAVIGGQVSPFEGHENPRLALGGATQVQSVAFSGWRGAPD